MTKLLFVQASPRKTESGCIQVAETYLDALCVSNPALEVDTIELWDADLPAFDGDKVAAKMHVIGGEDLSGVQASAWNRITEVADRFVSADRYLLAVPMWNNGIPYRLKHYIDVIHQPGLLWRLDPETGYHGLLEDKHATLALTSAVFAPHVASPEFGVDHQSTYLRAWLNQAGVTNIDEIRFQPSLLTADPAGELVQAKQRAVQLAQAHGAV
jgi:FMN-dependent NADH-azoreductase